MGFLRPRSENESALVLSVEGTEQALLLIVAHTTSSGAKSAAGLEASFARRVVMSQAVESPILPEGSPDRQVNCEVALEAAFADLVIASKAQGWTSQETAAALLRIATEHAQQVGALVANVSVIDAA